MTGRNCPSPERLSAYVLGELSEEEAEAIAEHVETCAECDGTMERLESREDSVVANLRRPPASAVEIETPECREVVDRIQALAPEAVAASVADSLVPGDLLGETRDLGVYRLLDKLGEGGMGAVYRALHTKLKRIVALKVLRRGKVQDARAVARFEREMAAVGQLDHPNIVRAHDAQVVEGTHFLVMEYVEGLDLSAIVQRTGPLGIAEACEVIRQAAQGLQYAHQHGLVHRDVKPSNLMLTASGEVKILDLGLALLNTPETGEEELTSAGQAMGTADYIAPEQTSDSHLVDIRADVYSLGCTLYKLLAGRPPFAGGRFRTTFHKMMAHVQEEVPPLTSRRSDVPQELATVLTRMLAKKPAERFATPGEVVAALERFARPADLPRVYAEASGPCRTASPPAFDEPVTPPADLASADTDSQARTGKRTPMPGDLSKSPPAGRGAESQPAWRRCVPWAVGCVALALLGGGVYLATTMLPNDDRSREGSKIEVSPGPAAENGQEPNPTAGLPPQPNADSIPVASPAPTGWQPCPADDALPGIVARPAKIPGIHRWQVETVVRRQRWDRMGSLAWNSNGMLGLASHGSGAIRVLDAETFALQRIFLGHKASVGPLTWLPDPQFLLSHDPQSGVRVWRTDGSLLNTFGGLRCEYFFPCPRGSRALVPAKGDSQATRVVHVSNGGGPTLQGFRIDARQHRWSPDGQWIANPMDGCVGLWRLNGTKGPVLERNSVALCWSPDSKQLACARADGKISRWNTDGTQDSLLEGHAGGVATASAGAAMAWSPDQRWFASGGADKTVRLWDAQGRPGPVLQGDAEDVHAVAWSPDGQYLAVSLARGIRIWQIGPQPKEVYRTPFNVVDQLFWRPDSKCLTIRSWLGELALVSLDGRPMRKAPQLTTGALAIAWNPEGSRLASYNDNTARVWSREGRLLKKLEGCERVEWQPDGCLALCQPDHVVVWDRWDAKGRPAQTIAPREDWNRYYGQWNSAGTLTAAMEGKRVQLRKADGTLVKSLEGHASTVCYVAWNSAGELLASADEQSEIRLWRSDGSPYGSLGLPGRHKCHGIAFHPNGREIAFAGDGVWACGLDGANPRKLDSCWEEGFAWLPLGAELHRIPEGVREAIASDPMVSRLAYSLRGSDLATVSGDFGWMRVLDLGTLQPSWSAVPFADQGCVSFTAAGQILEGDPAVCEQQLVYVVQLTPDGPQELWTFRQFLEHVRKAGLELWAGAQGTPAAASVGNPQSFASLRMTRVNHPD